MKKKPLVVTYIFLCIGNMSRIGNILIPVLVQKWIWLVLCLPTVTVRNIVGYKSKLADETGLAAPSKKRWCEISTRALWIHFGLFSSALLSSFMASVSFTSHFHYHFFLREPRRLGSKRFRFGIYHDILTRGVLGMTCNALVRFVEMMQ